MSRDVSGSRRRRSLAVAAGVAGVTAGALIVAHSAGGAVGPAVTVAARSTTTSATAAGGARFLPDRTLHPGAVNAAVTAGQVCAFGFSTSVFRPPVAYTNRVKRLELGGGGTVTGPSGATYTVIGEHLPGTVSDYELDHLISLEIGGNPEDPRNLWLEPWESKGSRLAPTGLGAESKDVVENRLHHEICAGIITISQAQAEMAGDWETAR